MKNLDASLFNFFTEAATLAVDNPLLKDPSKPFKEATVADLPVSAVRAVYPEVAAAHSDRLTKNFTWYSMACLRGHDSQEEDAATGLYSFVRPYGKPFLREHRSSDFFSEADVPMGRVVFSGFHKYKGGEVSQTPLSKAGYPGTAEGTGYLVLVPGITNEEAIEGVLSGVYHTVSIGSHVGGVIESISGKDIAALARAGRFDDMPEYRRGQVYNIDGEQKLSYWIMKDMHGIECSFVNVPADSLAKVTKRDIGESGIRLLLGEKKPGAKEFALYDAVSGEKVPWEVEEGAIDESFNLVDSLEVGRDTWLLGITKLLEESNARTTEGADEELSEMKTEKSKLTVDQIKEALPNLTAVKALRESEEYDTADFAETLREALETSSFDEKIVKAIKDGDASGFKVSNETLFQETLDLSIEIVGEFDEIATTLALEAYTAQEDCVIESVEEETPEEDDTDTSNDEGFVTLGELYSLSEDHALFTVESKLSRKALTELNESVFAGKNKTFPITNLDSAATAVRFCGGDPDIRSKAMEFGVVSRTDEQGKVEKYQLVPLMLEATDERANWSGLSFLYEVETVEGLTLPEGALTTYGEDTEEAVKAFLETAETAARILFTDSLEDIPLCEYKESSPVLVRLGSKFLFEAFQTQEAADAREFLLPLVALVRSQNLCKEEISEASKAYTIFGMRALESLWAAVPEKKPSSNTDEEDKSQESSDDTNTSTGGVPPVETQTNPAAASVQEGDSKEENKSDESWKTKLGRPLRRPSGKNKTPTKEKR